MASDIREIASAEDYRNADILSAGQFTQKGLTPLFDLADRMKLISRRLVKCRVLDSDVIGINFFEESTRTRKSAETAGYRLGAMVSSMTEMKMSSMSKGETQEDTISVLSQYSDLMVVRHPQEGFAETAARYSTVPVINAGDGPAEHPTQALLDMNTIRCRMGKIDDITVAMVGDLRYGRTVHSLTKLLSLHDNVKFRFIAPDIVKMPEEILSTIRGRGLEVIETDDMTGGIADADVVYMTRVQQNRFPCVEDYQQVNGVYHLNRQVVTEKCKEGVVIMHPLPRVNELCPDVDSLPNNAYLGLDSQLEYGVLIKMALYLLILGKAHKFV